MHTVQIVMADRDYAAQLEALLVRDGCHWVLHGETPDFARKGVVAMDLASFLRMRAVPPQPERVVLIAGREEIALRKAWDAGLRSVVYRDEPPQTVLLAIMAAELRVTMPLDSPSP
ncbi:MAG: hypothetical protein U5J83_00630 [Bryobacterales bacterium]|nr:hypothetical protein [Bryobacterales bacterium]